MCTGCSCILYNNNILLYFIYICNWTHNPSFIYDTFSYINNLFCYLHSTVPYTVEKIFCQLQELSSLLDRLFNKTIWEMARRRFIAWAIEILHQTQDAMLIYIVRDILERVESLGLGMRSQILFRFNGKEAKYLACSCQFYNISHKTLFSI